MSGSSLIWLCSFAGCRQAWTDDENVAVDKAFGKQIRLKDNVGASDIQEAMRRFPLLRKRSVANIRVKVNNIIKGKDKKFAK